MGEMMIVTLTFTLWTVSSIFFNVEAVCTKEVRLDSYEKEKKTTINW